MMGFEDRDDDQDEIRKAAQPQSSRNENVLGGSLQESIVTALVYKNDDNTNKLAKLMELDWFEDPYRDIVARALGQREKYHEAPGLTHVDDLFSGKLDPKHKDHSRLYYPILRGMMTGSGELNTQFVLDQLSHFAYRQTIKKAIFEAGTIISQSHEVADYDKAADILADIKNFRPPTTLPLMSIKLLLDQEFPPRVKILGDLITNQSRLMLVAPKGKGKTRLMLEMGLSIAMGKDFMHWKGDGKPRRVLYIDGELGEPQFRELYLKEALRRHEPFPDTIFFLFHDMFPDGMPALNTRAGQKLIERAIDECAPDVVFFDNIQCLLEFDDSHKAKAWIKTLKMVRWSTPQNIRTNMGETHRA